MLAPESLGSKLTADITFQYRNHVIVSRVVCVGNFFVQEGVPYYLASLPLAARSSCLLMPRSQSPEAALDSSAHADTSTRKLSVPRKKRTSLRKNSRTTLALSKIDRSPPTAMFCLYVPRSAPAPRQFQRSVGHLFRLPSS